jgi:sulfopyruvate decarboxylase subunit alpha
VARGGREGWAVSACDVLAAAGFDFFTGVPDSTFKELLAELEARPDLGWVPAVAEDVAVGLATGAALGGRTPVVVMQNSGLGLAVNALASLALLYEIPMLLLVGWRGHDGRDAPEHTLMGGATLPLLHALAVPHRLPAAGGADRELAAAGEWVRAERRPCALVCRPGVIA